MFLAGDGGDEGALAAAHVADDAHQLARPHAAADVLQHDALRRQAVAVVVHARRRRRQRPVVGAAGLISHDDIVSLVYWLLIRVLLRACEQNASQERENN